MKIIVAQLLLTVDFMSRKGIIHRDLKPENILLNSKEKGNFDIRIADFGFSILKASEDPNEKCEVGLVCGTGGYIPPEALHGDGYTLKSDVFSVGSIMYSLLSMRNLFFGKDQLAILEQNKLCPLDHVIPHTRGSSETSQDLMLKLLTVDPLLRPTAAEALEHAWFSNEQGALIGSLTINVIFSMGERRVSQPNLSISKLGKKLVSRNVDLIDAVSSFH